MQNNLNSAYLNGLDRFLSGGVGPFLSHGEVSLYDRGQRSDVGRLAHVAVLEETLLGNMRLLQVDAQLEILEHNLQEKKYLSKL